MARDISPEEARDEQVDELTNKRCQDWCTRLLAGEQRAINDLRNCVLDRLAAEDAAALFVQAVTDPAGADVKFAALAAKVMRDEAECDAIREVERMEQAAKNDPDNCKPKTRAVAAFLARQD